MASKMVQARKGTRATEAPRVVNTQEVGETPGMVLDEVLRAIRRANAVNTALECYVVFQEVCEPKLDICQFLTSIVEDELREAERLASGLSKRLSVEHLRVAVGGAHA